VRERATSHAVGTVQATIKPGQPAALAELAWVIGTRHQHQGFAKEAVGLIAAWLHEQGVRSLRAHIHSCHYASMAVARSIGPVPTQTIADGELRWQSSQPGGHADADPPHAT
jgi:RimJ/RimL family protein N-acetyltransferase